MDVRGGESLAHALLYSTHFLDHWFPKLCWEELQQIGPHLTVLHYWSPANNQNVLHREKSIKVSNPECQPKAVALQPL